MTQLAYRLTTQYSVTDLEQIRTLVKEVGVFTRVEIEVAVELLEFALTEKEPFYQFIFARVSAGHILGYTCFGETPLTDKRFDLYWLVVSSLAQRQGLGQVLFLQTETTIREQGGQRIYAETSGTEAYAKPRAFYQKMGMCEVARIFDFYRQGDDKVIYCRAY